MPEPVMIDFEIYIDDDRYSVPSLYLITAANEAWARVLANKALHDSKHHQGVELLRNGERLFALGSLALGGSRAEDWVDAAAL
jgi:hypothetical protein